MNLELDKVLRVGFQGGASDIHLKAGLPPMFRIEGRLVALKGGERLTPEEIESMALEVMDKRQLGIYREKRELDLAYGVSGLGRFRINVFQQRGSMGLAIRTIPFKVPSFEELNLPPIMSKIAESNRGLILVTGTTGSGKSSTLAAIINHINNRRTCHIMTIEDPIEFLIRDRKSMINQRELGVDTFSFANALRAALRQDPDVIFIGELRDLETVETALAAAETGHLVLSTLHTLDAAETINRMISMFPPYQQTTVRLQLVSVLTAVFSQRLVACEDGKGRLPAVEVLRTTHRVRELIEDPAGLRELRDVIAEGYDAYGMQTFDQSLMDHLVHKRISMEQALQQASNPDDFKLRLQGVVSASDGRWEGFEGIEKPAKLEDDFDIERF